VREAKTNVMLWVRNVASAEEGGVDSVVRRTHSPEGPKAHPQEVTLSREKKKKGEVLIITLSGSVSSVGATGT